MYYLGISKVGYCGGVCAAFECSADFVMGVCSS